MPLAGDINTQSRRLVIVGAGGHGLEILWVAARMSLEPIWGAWNAIGFVDDRVSTRGRMIEGLSMLGSVKEFLDGHRGEPLFFHCALGNNRQRQKLAELFEAEGFQPATIIDPSAIISPRASIGAGTYVGPRCYVGPGAKIGRHVLINVAASVGHHCMMDDFSQACPGARLSGHCVIETLAFLGSNAVVYPGKRVGEGATVGASSFAVRNVGPHTVVVGVPARVIQDTGADVTEQE